MSRAWAQLGYTEKFEKKKKKTGGRMGKARESGANLRKDPQRSTSLACVCVCVLFAAGLIVG